MWRWVLLFVLIVAWPVLAQDDDEGFIELGETINATADQSNADYQIELTAEMTVEIALSSRDFDTFLEILGPDDRVIAENDDRAPGTLDSFVSFIVPVDGLYTILVRSWIGTADGRYRLTVDERDAADCGDLCVGDEIEGVATENLSLSIRLDANQPVVIRADSPDFDTVLEVYDTAGDLIAQNDDSTIDNFNSQLEVLPPVTGDYTVILRAFSGDAIGAYSLSLEANEVRLLNGGELLFEQVVRVDPRGTERVAFTFMGDEDETINLRAESSTDEDSFLMLYDSDGILLIADDDSGGNLNPLIARYRLPETGEYFVELSGFEDEPLVEPFTILLEQSEEIFLQDGQRTITFDQNTLLEVIELELVEDVVYAFDVTSDDAIGFVEIFIVDEDDAFLVGALGDFVDALSFTHTALYTGFARMEIRVDTLEAQDITISVLPQ